MRIPAFGAARALLAAALFASAPAPLASQQHAVGEWHGVLATPMGKLTVRFAIRRAAEGVLAGDMESVDQAPGQLIPLADVVATNEHLAFAVPQIGARFEGEWQAPGRWSGTFRQGTAFPLVLEPGPPAAAPVVAGLDGTWRASLKRESATLRLVLHVRTAERGTQVTLDSPDLNAFGLPVEGFTRSGSAVRFAVPSASVVFEGTLEGERQLRGQWLRTGQPEAQVTFEREAVVPAERPRSQLPIVPHGYRAEDVEFANDAAPAVRLAGTLTLPDGAGPFPAAVLISGSGPQDRDETIFGHKPFAVLADHLSRHGIAVLRYDDRGYARSTGDHALATSADFASDANAAVRFLRGRPEIAGNAVGVIGHSEGGLIGPLAAMADARIAFVVLLAGPGTRGDELLLAQRRATGPMQGLSAAQLEASEPAVRRLFAAVRSSRDPAQAALRVDALLTPGMLRTLGVPEAQREAVRMQFGSPWMWYFLRIDPRVALSRLRVPVLALNGSLDRQVPAAANLAGIRAALAHDRDVTVRELPGLNHMFQAAVTGAVGEYADIAETFSPSAMELVGEWINARFGQQRG